MVIDRRDGSIAHRYVRDLVEILASGDCLIVNDTRVVSARLIGFRTMTGGRWEGLFLSADSADGWKILARTRGKAAVGEWITLTNRQGLADIRLRLVERQSDGIWRVQPESDEAVYQLLERVGRVPLPCYIRGGQSVPADLDRYQTVYAESPGSAAAPTAGLHFTEKLLKSLRERGVHFSQVTLHVGIDTFRPIQTERIEDHVMHSEWGELMRKRQGWLSNRISPVIGSSPWARRPCEYWNQLPLAATLHRGREIQISSSGRDTVFVRSTRC